MKYPSYKYFFAIIDFLTVVCSLFITEILLGLIFAHKGYEISNIYSYVTYVIVSAICIFIFQYNNLYKINVILTKALQITLIIKSLFYTVIVLIFFSFIFKYSIISDSRLFIFTFMITNLIASILIRVLIVRIIYTKFLNKNLFVRRIIICGAGKAGKLMAQKLLFEDSYGIEVIGFLDDSVIIGEEVFQNLKVLGSAKDLSKAVKEYTIDEVIIAIDKISYERLYEISDICLKEKVNVKVSSELFDVIPQKFFIEEYSSIPVIDISTKIDIKIFYIFKKITDIILTIIGLLILLPFLILISVLIKIESKGPILFAQKRVGKNGKIFKFYKFRSMTISEKDDIERENMMIDFIKNNKKQFVDSAKIINEKRLTKIGKFLRKYSLDELPQLFNVIKGEMSLVGPRPCLPYEYENFDEWHKRRNSVLPGCTGVWQVAGRGEVSFDDSVVLDLYYINNVSPWLDIQLMIKTIPVMISAKGK